MSNHSERLEQKRRELQLRCALQRQHMMHLCERIEGQLVTGDRIAGVVVNVTKRPLVVIAAIAGTLIIGPWRILRWAGQGAMLFSVFRKIQQLVGK